MKVEKEKERGMDKEVWDKLYGRSEPWSGVSKIVDVAMTLFSPQSVLDIGAGRGDFLFYSEKYIPSAGIDISRWCIDHKFCKSDILHANASSLPFQDKSFSLSIALDLLDYLTLDHLPLALKEIRRVTKKCIILLPSVIQWHENECVADDPSKDKAGHLIFKHDDWWISTIAHIFDPEFFLDIKNSVNFLSILNRQGSNLQNWKHLEIWRKNNECKSEYRN